MMPEFYVVSFHELLKMLAECGSAIVFFSLMYRFFTTQSTREYHHRKIRVAMYLIHNISWFNLAKGASSYVLYFLNKIYGVPESAGKLFTRSYFNERSWKASFFFSLFYMTLGILILPFFSNPTFNDEGIVIKLLTLVILFVLGFFMINKVKRPILVKNIDFYRVNFLCLAAFFFTSLLFSCGAFSGQVFLLIVLVGIPIFSVSRYGLIGFLSYVLGVVVYFCFVINFFALYWVAVDVIKEYHNNDLINIMRILSGSSESGSDGGGGRGRSSQDYGAIKFNFINLFLLCAFVLIWDKKKYSYRVFCKRLFVITSIFPTTVMLSKMSIEQAHLAFIYLFYFAYAWFFIWGIVAANSIADWISANVSRWLFLEIKKYNKWGQILNASLIDIFVGSVLVLVTSVLIAGMLFSVMIIIWKDSPVGLYQAEMLTEHIFGKATSSKAEIIKFVNNFSVSYIIDPIINSYYLLPRYFSFDYSYKDNVDPTYASHLNELGYVLWYMYCTTLIPSFMHICVLIFLFVSKGVSSLIQGPSLYLHKLLIENSIDDGVLGKAFSGDTRAIIFIGSFLALTVFLIYSVLKHIYTT